MLIAERLTAASFLATTALLSCRARHRSTLLRQSQKLSTSDLIVIADFDLTLTCGGSTQCHDVLGSSPLQPAGVRAAFEPLLDFTTPFPPELDGNGWWVRANEILLAHGAPRQDALRGLVTDAEMEPRPGAAALLGRLARDGVPVLVVSAGFADVIEEWLRLHGLASPNVRVSSNRLRWDDGTGTMRAVEPSPPVTSLNKEQTAARNAEWLAQHAARRSLLVLGDRCSDLAVAQGVDSERRVAVGLVNDQAEYGDAPSAEARCAEYARCGFDVVLRGSRASLEPVLELIQ